MHQAQVLCNKELNLISSSSTKENKSVTRTWQSSKKIIECF